MNVEDGYLIMESTFIPGEFPRGGGCVCDSYISRRKPASLFRRKNEFLMTGLPASEHSYEKWGAHTHTPLLLVGGEFISSTHGL